MNASDIAIAHPILTVIAYDALVGLIIIGCLAWLSRKELGRRVSRNRRYVSRSGWHSWDGKAWASDLSKVPGAQLIGSKEPPLDFDIRRHSLEAGEK